MSYSWLPGTGCTIGLKTPPGRVISADTLILAERPVVVLVVAERQDVGRILVRRERRRLLLLTGVRRIAGRTRDIPHRDYGAQGVAVGVAAVGAAAVAAASA